MRARVLTVSDRVAAGAAEDISGPAVVARLQQGGFEVELNVVADGRDSVGQALRDLSEGFQGLLVTTGGTGFSPRDETPEATLDVVDRLAPGMVTALALANLDKGRLSRQQAGTAGRCLIINLPGSTKGAIECLEAVIGVLPHALELLADQSTQH